MTGSLAHVEIHWLTAEEGGRQLPFVGQRYTTTARFVGEQELFSVVCFFPNSKQANPASADLTLLNPGLDRIQKRISAGRQLEITEGPKLVARCQVLSVQPS